MDDRWKAPNTRCNGSIRPNLPNAGNGNVGPSIERINKVAQLPGEQLGVRIQEEHVTSIGGRQSAVIRVAEPPVRALESPHSRKALGHVAGGPIRPVVNEHDVEIELACVLKDAI